MLLKLKNYAKRLLASDFVRRVVHTFWQAAGGVLIAGLLAAHSSADAKAALSVALATGLAAVKAYLVARG